MSLADKLIATCFAIICIFCCVLQVIIANKNRKIKELKKSLALTTKQLTKQSEDSTKTGKEG